MLLSFPTGWNLDVPAGTLLIRVDVVMNTRPGAGGYCAIIEASDLKESVLIRGGESETNTERLMKILALRLAEEIQGNRAVVLVRNMPMYQSLSAVFKPFKMIRLLGHSPMAVSDATRHAHVMAERSLRIQDAHEERFMFARFEPSKEDFSENQDTQSMHAAMQHLIKKIGFADLNSPQLKKAAQAVLNASEREIIAFQRDAIQKQTANDIPKATIDKENY